MGQYGRQWEETAQRTGSGRTVTKNTTRHRWARARCHALFYGEKQFLNYKTNQLTRRKIQRNDTHLPTCATQRPSKGSLHALAKSVGSGHCQRAGITTHHLQSMEAQKITKRCHTACRQNNMRQSNMGNSRFLNSWDLNNLFRKSERLFSEE